MSSYHPAPVTEPLPPDDHRTPPVPTPGQAWAAMKDWTAPGSPAEEASFAEYRKAVTKVWWPMFGFAMAAAALIWWPTDPIVYPDDPVLRETFGQFRWRVAAVAVAFAVTLPRLPLVARRPEPFAIGAGMALLGLTGWWLGAIGRGDPAWLYYVFLAPFLSMLLLLPLGARAVATALFAASALGGWVAHPGTSFAAPGAAAGASFLVFCCGVAVFFGHALFGLVRRSYHLERRVSAQRGRLAELAGRLEARVAEQTRSLRELHSRAQDVRARQRHEMARDLHDDLGQELTSLRLLVGIARQFELDGSALDLLGELDGQVGRVQESLRGILVSLRPQLLDDQGVVEALRFLAQDMERRSGLAISLETDDVPEPLPPSVSVTLYRIAQEALTNVVRHARASTVRVRLAGTGQAVELEVADDGVGIAADRVGKGLGTLSIRERAESEGGSASWSVDDGTRVRVRIPLEPR